MPKRGDGAQEQSGYWGGAVTKALEMTAVADVGWIAMAIFLNLRRPHPTGHIVIATCAISGAPERLYGIDRTFADVEETANILRAAGIPDHRYIMPLMAVNSGYGSFLEVSETEASSLGLLANL